MYHEHIAHMFMSSTMGEMAAAAVAVATGLPNLGTHVT